MLDKSFHIKTHYFLAMAIAFCLPFARLTPVFIALFLLNWLLEGDFKNKFKILVRNKFFWLFESLYLIHLFGLIYTENVPSGLFDLEVKLSIFIFPMIFCSRPLNSEQINQVLKVFMTGGIASSLIMFSRAVFLYFTSGANSFFYEAFSFLIHPSYLSMYFNFLIIWLLLGLLKKGEIRAILKPVYTWAIIIFFSFINVLLSSKMGMLSMTVIFLGFGIYYIILSQKYLLGAVSLVIFISAIIFSSIYVPAIEHRVSFAIAALTKKEIQKESDESSEVRILIWKAANGIIADHPVLGVGTGDAKDVLMNEYAKREMSGAIGHKLNAHNEFYQIFIALGLVGFLILVSNLLFPFIEAFKFHHSLYVLYLLLIILNFFSESMLETQAGVMFITFVNSMLCFSFFGIGNNIAAVNSVKSNLSI